MTENPSNTDTSDITEKEITDSEIIVIMDGFGGEWTPSAAMTNTEEAAKLKSMLSKDAQAVCSIAPWYQSKENVRENTKSNPPDELPDEIAICFYQDTTLCVSADDIVCREMQIKEGNGLRGTVSVYETAEEVAADKPAVIGQFIQASNTTAEDLLDSIE